MGRWAELDYLKLDRLSDSSRTLQGAKDIGHVPQRNTIGVFQTCLSTEPFSQNIFGANSPWNLLGESWV